MIHPAISEIVVRAPRPVELSTAAGVPVSRLIHRVTRQRRGEMSTAQSGTAITKSERARPPSQLGLVGPDLLRLRTDTSVSPTEFESYGIPRRLPLALRSGMANKVALLEGRLFDDEGHLRPGLSDEVATTRLGKINDLRRDLGWLWLDLHHDYVWPADIAS